MSKSPPGASAVRPAAASPDSASADHGAEVANAAANPDDADDSDDAEDSDNTENSDDVGDSDDTGDSNDEEDSDDAEDSDDTEGADDAEDSDDAEDASTPKTPLQKLVALADKACGLIVSPRDLINEGLASHTRALSAAWPALPAATVGSLAIGLPHAHPAHPPFVPMVPIGPAIVGFSSDVLINGMPALTSGALGMSPTCCGLTPFFEVCTGSSKVLIGGERAVRMLDLSFHCQSAARASSRTTAPRLRQALETTERALLLTHQAEDAADFAALGAEASASSCDAQATQNPALRAALTHSVSMATTSRLAAQAQHQMSMALIKLMGGDPAAPGGTPGAMMQGAANVLIGGFPVPGALAIVRGLRRLLPGKLASRPGGRGKAVRR